MANEKFNNRKINLALEAFLLLFLPIAGFILFSFITYPLSPHCDLGKGLLGCTPYCVKRGASYEKVPCFHESATKLQIFSYKSSLIYYSILFLPIAILFVLLGAERFYNLVLRIAFYPFYLFRDSRKQSLITRVICTLFLIPIIIEWFIGYAVLIGMILGVSVFA